MRLDNPFDPPTLMHEHLEDVQAPVRLFEARLLAMFERIAQRHYPNVPPPDPPPEPPDPPGPVYHKLRLVKRNARL